MHTAVGQCYRWYEEFWPDTQGCSG